MEQKNLNNIIKENYNKLDGIYEHTEYKIKYIVKYVENWLYVSTNNPKIKNINFIDCMCNAGVYQNGVLGTPVEVLKLFIEFAPNHKDKMFNLFLNDYDIKRINIVKQVMDLTEYKKSDNIKLIISNKDVNDYLAEQKSNTIYFGSKNFNALPSTILFVDPYCFGEVKIKAIIDFLHTNYSELIFNYFNSDYRRNINNTSTPNKVAKIVKSMDGIKNYNTKLDEKEVMELIKSNIKLKNIKYCFSYPFRISTNIELYHIIFATPNSAGLIKIKTSLWDVFKGDIFFRNNGNIHQLCLLGDDDIKSMNAQNFAEEARKLLTERFNGLTVSFNEISNFVLENTMLKESHIIKYLLNPLIDEKLICKNNLISKSNYKNDQYSFLGMEIYSKV